MPPPPGPLPPPGPGGCAAGHLAAAAGAGRHRRAADPGRGSRDRAVGPARGELGDRGGDLGVAVVDASRRCPRHAGPETICESAPRPPSPLPPIAVSESATRIATGTTTAAPVARNACPIHDRTRSTVLIVGAMRKLSIGRAVRVGLLGVTLLLGAISAFAVAGIFDARQDYEDKLADSYELQVSAGRLLTAGVLETAVLDGGASAPRARARSRRRHSRRRRAPRRGLRASDPESAEIVRRRIAAQERAREAAGSGDSAQDAPDPLGSALLTARALSRDLSARQEERRDEARDDVERRHAPLR